MTGGGVFIALTGRPGVGKTTAVMRVADALKPQGVKVGGIYTKEVRRGGARVGFDVIDILTGESSILARVGSTGGPRVGKYVVYVEELESKGVKAIERALETCDVVVVDEIGPMELKSSLFVKTVERLMHVDKPVVATVHLKARDPLVVRVKARAGKDLITLDENNRDSTVELIVNRIRAALGW
ncbi:MAG TPA: NTPase [Candidatus Caldiarchaeum subterraneum]|uniref:Nucleoside-triphosphatase EYH45_03305 n=1 Tax=Caldiarchaeum subterraneum TaxID=311458 RepID=A0A832ZW69_CALS0|nr:NTPase [Aigarchaeota archaeon]HIQ29571.1 NTPase [Candidatus Caldarchaeum subterraneum]